MYVTKHSKKRIKERMGLPKKSIQRQATLAIERGYSHRETKGNLRKYIDRVYLSHRQGNNIKVYNNHIFVFQNTILITVLKIPAKLQGNKYLKLKVQKGVRNEL